ncbi:MAG: TonB-dependent receptor plug domain-containing protein [FCB group bacterium]|nr:TonB-dependent receptor plug domain-containing protein [FCB group bacterium]
MAYRIFHRFVESLILIFVTSALLWAGTDGTIRGQVKDMDGNGLPGAQVFIQALGVGAVADVEGNYIILNIPVGTYDVTVMMIGYQTQVRKNVEVIMDKTLWLNFNLPVAAIEGEAVEVVGQKEMVEKGSTAKKITVDQEAVESLPIRDVTELYALQSGVVKVESRNQGIPDHEARGLEEVHVRGGRSGEIAYMIDGLYIRNPIFGGIGNGTRLNLFAVKEFDWQPGGFNAEYGDAMSAVSNMHTNLGGDEFQYKFKYESSMAGAAMGSKFDDLRGYNDYNLAFGGSVPGLSKFKYWLSGQYTDRKNYRVFKFDDLFFVNDPKDPFQNANREKMVQPWDNQGGFRGFGFDRTWDVFTKLGYNPTNRIRMNVSYWQVGAHRKGFNPRYLYWDAGQNELFRDTYRYTFELNQSITSSIFYSFRVSRFIQDQFQGVRWRDDDKDGYPNWFEYRHPAGPDRAISDPYNPLVIPYSISENGDTLYYTKKDELSGWYYGATPGLYNWEVAEDFTDVNGNGIYDEGIDRFNLTTQDKNNNGKWDGPVLTEKAVKRDGSYWLLPEMYEDYSDFEDYRIVDMEYSQDPWWSEFVGSAAPRSANRPNDAFYYMPSAFGNYAWNERRAFGGHDRFYGTSRAITTEYRTDFTAQVTDKWKVRSGFDYKTHKLNFYEVKNPWLGQGAFIQSFAEYWNDTGPDGLLPTDEGYNGPDPGEGNGKWDQGESFSDANGNGVWDNYREPAELSMYVQNTFEVPWMVINAGVRVDMVNYHTQIWADTLGNYSPGRPWYYADIGEDGKPNTGDRGEDDDQWNYNEPASDSPGFSTQKVIFTPANWFYKISPRLGFSHVITDRSTFTFNYGVYYQTPIYQNVYLNTNRLEDPETLFEEGEGVLGNATMNASRTQSYEFGFNVQVGRHWAYTIAGWVKDMDQLVTYRNNRSGVYTYQVFSNGDYGSAKGIDFTLENRGRFVNAMLQYTYSIAKASSEHDWAALGSEAIDAPSQEYLMPYDRPHDLTLSIYSRLPFGIKAALTGFYQSGYPYTPLRYNGNQPEEDTKNKYSKRAPSYKTMNLSLSKYVPFADYRVTLGMNVYNLFNIANAVDIWPLTGKPNDPGEYYTDFVGLPDATHDKSASYYDQPWYYSNPREINFFVRIDFR